MARILFVIGIQNNIMKRIILSALAIFAFNALFAQGLLTGTEVGNLAPELKLPNPDGKVLPLSSLKGKMVLIDFWASWCGPCRSFAPTFEAASQRHPDVVFGKVDTEAQQGLASYFQIQAIPTLMVFREKVMLFNQAGSLPPKSLEDLLQQVKKLDMAEVHRQIAAHSHSHEHGENCDH